MIITSTFTIPNKEIDSIVGLVNGSIVKTKHVGRDILAVFKNIFGGEIKSYTALVAESRQEAIDRMIKEAEKLNADAIVGIRFSSSSIAAGASEIHVYGTAIKFKS